MICPDGSSKPVYFISYEDKEKMIFLSFNFNLTHLSEIKYKLTMFTSEIGPMLSMFMVTFTATGSPEKKSAKVGVVQLKATN